MKQNDWIIASINNPTFTVGDFQNIADMSLDNTQLLSKDEYLKSNFIRNNELFKDNNGKFSEDKFTQFYDNAASNFAQFSTENIIDNYKYSIWDTHRPKDAQTRDIGFSISTVSNPQHLKIGIAGPNTVTLSDKSNRELAQNSKIYDPSTNTFLDKSVNDISLLSNPLEYFKSFLDEPLVYATYDEDTIEKDPSTGKDIKHFKGEWKVNDEGEYYTEKLNGRSLLGKTVVSTMDYVTNENSSINKYDPFDSDGLDKSTIGSVTKSLVQALPIFIPYVGMAYGGLLVGREMLKTLPMLYGIINSFNDDEVKDNKLLNTLAAYGEKLSGGVSDYSQQNTFTVENIANLFGEVVLQFGQQSAIINSITNLLARPKQAQITALLKANNKYRKEASDLFTKAYEGKISKSQLSSYLGTDNIADVAKLANSGWENTIVGKAAIETYMAPVKSMIEKRTRLGQDLALMYMALVSNTDVYNQVLEKGGTGKEAAAITLGSIAGMFSVDRFLGLGEMFFQKPASRLTLRESSKKAVNDFLGTTNKKIDTTTKNGIIGALKKGVVIGKNAVKNYFERANNGTLSLVGKSLGEGLEEVSEELVSDFSKWAGEIAGDLGYASQTDYGAWDNAFERYAMSFVGGSLGGAMFGLKEVYDNKDVKKEEYDNKLTYLLRQGKRNDIVNEISKMYKKDPSRFGSTELSYDLGTDGVYLTASENRKSQAQTNYDNLVRAIDQLDMILERNNLKLSENDLFNKLVQGEYNEIALSDFLKGDNIGDVKEVSYLSNFQNDFQKLLIDIKDKELEIQQKINSVPDQAKKTDSQYNEELDKLKKEKQELTDKLNYLFGEGSLGYVEKTLFAMDPILNQHFGTFNFNQFVRERYSKSASELSEAELQSANEAFGKLSIKQNLDTAFDLFKKMGENINPSIKELQSLNPKELMDSIKELRDGDPLKKLLSNEDKLESETMEEYLSLQAPKEGETKEQYNERVRIHNENIKKYNEDNIHKWIQEYLKTPITSTDRRSLAAYIGQGIQTLLRNATSDLTSFDNNISQELRDIIINKGIKLEDGAANDELRNDIKNKIKDKIGSAITDIEVYGDSKKVLNKVDDLINKNIEELKKSYPEYNHTNGAITNWDLAIIKELDENLYNEVLNTLDEEGITNINTAEIIDGEFKNNETYIAVNEDNKEDIIKNDSDKYYRQYENDLNVLIDTLKNNDVYKTLTELENNQTINNPIIPILKEVSKQSNNENLDIEEFLQGIYNIFSRSDNPQDFQLSKEQIDKLKQILQDLDIAWSFIYAASSDKHNKHINQFANNHKDVFKKYKNLPEIDENIANYLLNEINNYKKEINLWIQRSEQNTKEIKQKIIKSNKAVTKGLIDFFKNNREAFKLKNIDLLNGFENLTIEDTLSSLLSIQNLIYSNYKNNSSIQLEDILDEILSKLGIKVENLLNQDSIRLDENFKASLLTDYNKFQIIVSSIAIDYISFYENLLEKLESNNDLIPIVSQEFSARIAYAQQENPELINRALKYIKDKNDNNYLDYLRNTTITEGLGGTGKTFAVVGLNVGTGKDTWISGPGQRQIDNLQKSLPDATPKTIEDIFELVFGTKEPDLSKYTNRVSGTYNTKSFELKDNITLNKIQNAPKNLVIDECTHLNTQVLIVLSEICRENNINLKLLGDRHQRGYLKNNVGNIENNSIIAWRTPELSISLRSNNILKSENQSYIVQLYDKIEQTLEINKNDIKKIYDEEFSKISLKYYNEESVSGDMIVNTLNDDILSKIPKKDTSIVVIGTEDSDSYKKLKDSGYNVVALSPLNVQGSEFDYAIVDQDWKFDSNQTPYNLGVDMLEFLQKLYTYMSRSRQAAIFIDNGLSNIINTVKSQNSGEFNPIANAVTEFRKTRIQEIKEALELVQKPQNTSDQSITTVRDTKHISSSGNVSTGKYVQKGNVIVYEGDSVAKIVIKDVQNADDIEGDLDNGVHIDSVTIDPSGIVINTAEGVTIKGDSAKELYRTMFSQGLPLYENNENIQSFELDGGVLKLPDILPEEDKSKQRTNNINKDDKQHENADMGVTDNLPLEDQPITVFSNVSYSGINTSGDDWVNDSDSTADLGILISNGETVSKGKQYRAMEDLLKLKCAFIFYNGGENLEESAYRKIPEEFRELFGRTLDKFKDTCKEAKYYISVEEANDNNRLIGLTKGTGLLNDTRTIGSGKKVVKVIVKLKGLNGKEYALSLGGLNNPDTWELNKQDIVKAITEKEKISESAAKGNLEKTIKAYRAYIDNITQNLQEIEIEKPDFSTYTYLRKLPNGYQRLENIGGNKKPYYRTYSPIQVESDPYRKMEDIPGIKEISNPIRFISSNLLLDSEELKTIYLNQVSNPDLGKMVRMDVMGNVGVSFKSLYQSTYSDVYNIQKGDTTFTVPFELYPTALRMYISMWNFRAGLHKFLNEYDKFLNTHGLIEDNVNEICKLDNKYYQEFKRQNDSKNPKEKEYRNWVSNNNNIKQEDKDSIKKIWDFNDGLSTLCREFRLGYSTGHGAYLRGLTNLNDTKLFTDKQKNKGVVGIYINPEIARVYAQRMDNLFTNIVDPLISPISNDTNLYVNYSLSDIKNWVNKSKDKGFLKLTVQEDNSVELNLNIESANAVRFLPIAIIKTAKSLNWYIENFNDIEESEQIFPMKYEKNGVVKRLNWLGVLEDTGSINLIDDWNDSYNNKPGFIKVTQGGRTRAKDSRVDDMFNLMFHGLISTKVPNDFTGNDIRATFAYFKNGFYSDPIIALKKGEGEEFASVITSNKLVQSEMVTSGTMFKIKLKEKKGTNNKPVDKPVDEPEDTNTKIEELTNKLPEYIKNSIAYNGTNYDEFVGLVKGGIKSKLEHVLSNNNLTIDDIIVGIDNDNNPISLRQYLISEKVFEDTDNIEITHKKNHIELKINDNKEVTIQLSPQGKILINDSQSNPTTNLSQNKEAIKDILEEIQIDQGDIYSTIQNETFIQNYLKSSKVNRNDNNTVVGKLIEIIEKNIEDEETKNSLVNDLEQLKVDTNCSI